MAARQWYRLRLTDEGIRDGLTVGDLQDLARAFDDAKIVGYVPECGSTNDVLLSCAQKETPQKLVDYAQHDERFAGKLILEV